MSKRKRGASLEADIDVCDLASFKWELQEAVHHAKQFIFDKLEDVKKFIRPHVTPRVAVFDCVAFQLHSNYRHFLGNTDGALRRFTELVHPQRILHEYHKYEQFLRNNQYSQTTIAKFALYQEWLSVALQILADLLFFIVRVPGFLYLDLGVLHALDEAMLALLVASWQLETFSAQFDRFQSPILTQFVHLRRAIASVKLRLPRIMLFTREYCLRSHSMLEDALSVVEVALARHHLSTKLPPELVEMVVAELSVDKIPSVDIPQVYRAWPKSWPAAKHNCPASLPRLMMPFRSYSRLVGWSHHLKQFVLLVSCCNIYLVYHWNPRKPAVEITAADMGVEPFEPWQVLWDIAGY